MFSHVLEHLSDPAESDSVFAFVETAVSHLCWVPNIMVWNRRLRHLLNAWNWRTGVWIDPPLAILSFEEYSGTVRSAGFIVTFCSVIGHIPQPGIRRVIPQISSRLDRLACSRAPDLFGFHLPFCPEGVAEAECRALTQVVHRLLVPTSQPLTKLRNRLIIAAWFG